MKKVSKRTFKESEVKEHIVTFCFEPRMVVSCSNSGEEGWIDDGFVWEDVGQRTIDDAINSLLKQDEAEGCDLAKYVDDNLKGIVKTIKMEWQSRRDELLLVHCTLTTEPTEQIIEDLKDYLEGQMSDGWGEGFEQQELASSSYIVVANENDTNGYDEMFFFDKSQWRYAEAKAEEMNEAANGYGDEDEDEDDDARLTAESVIEGREYLPALRLRGDLTVADTAVIRLDELAAGNQPGGDGA